MGDGWAFVMSMEQVLAVIGAVILILLSVIGYFLSGIHKDFREMEKTLPDKYVRKDDFHRALDELKGMLQRIFDKLDTKQDKGE